MDRRTFLIWLARLSGASALTTVGVGACKNGGDKPEADADTAKVESPTSRPAPIKPPVEKLEFFTDAEADVLRAMLDRLLPSGGPDDPGARDVGVINFIDAEMRKKDFVGLHRMIRSGLKFMDAVGNRRHKGRFSTLSGQEQDQILRDFQTGSIGGLKFPQAKFFATMMSFALEGYLGAPKHGGNHEKLAWKAYGIDPTCHNMFTCE